MRAASLALPVAELEKYREQKYIFILFISLGEKNYVGLFYKINSKKKLNVRVLSLSKLMKVLMVLIRN